MLGTWCLFELVFERKEKPYTKEEAEAAENNFKAPIYPLNYLDSMDEKE
jgi:hypothetical protein